MEIRKNSTRNCNFELVNSLKPICLKKYNMEHIFKKASTDALLDLPDYTCPSVTIQDCKGSGRGIFAQSDLQPGQLIIAEKAISIIFPNDKRLSGVPGSSTRKLGKMNFLQQDLSLLLKNNSNLVPKLSNLYCGNYTSRLVKNGEVNKSRIERICQLNNFEGGNESSYDTCLGLWDTPSYLNHSCGDSNAHWKIFKNMLFIRASRFIQEDEEILISYFLPNTSYAERKAFFIKHDFICQCRLCEVELSEGENIWKERDDILLECQMVSTTYQLETRVRILEVLRQKSPELNVFLLEPLMQLGLRYYDNMQYKDACRVFIRCFELCKLSAQFCSIVVNCALTIATCQLREHVKKSELSIVQEWINICKKCIQVEYGDGTSCLKVMGMLRPTFVLEMRNCGFNLD